MTHDARRFPWAGSRLGLGVLLGLAIVGFLLVTDHASHFADVLPYLLLLACPLMHFLHRGHHDRHNRHTAAGGRDGDASRADVTHMRSADESVVIEAPATVVFAHVDDMANIGGHMTDRSSMPMMGSSLKLERASSQATGVGATYRYSGKVLGLTIDFSEVVTRYVPGREKVWRTVGTPRLVIIDSYEMRVAVDPVTPAFSRLTISIAYTLPHGAGMHLLARLLAPAYARWCLRSMCRDAKTALEVRRAA